MQKEDQFIQHLAKTFPALSPLVGIGDDCAVIPTDTDEAWVVTADALVEGIHFLKEEITPQDLGYKTVAVSISDVASMGGLPKYAFLSLAIPKNTDYTWLCAMMEGIKAACEKWEVQLLGGDTVGSKRDLFLNLTLIGTAKRARIKYRSGAKVGDIICVSGPLGDAAGGLKALQERAIKTPEVEYLLRAHFHPEIDLEQGIALAAQEGVHAMMDLSDGLDCDLKRLLKSSEKGAIIETSQLPLSKAFLKACQDNKWDRIPLALSGGEDYRLLITLSQDAFDTLHQTLPLQAIGRITESRDLLYQKEGQTLHLELAHFEHF